MGNTIQHTEIKKNISSTDAADAVTEKLSQARAVIDVLMHDEIAPAVNREALLHALWSVDAALEEVDRFLPLALNYEA